MSDDERDAGFSESQVRAIADIVKGVLIETRDSDRGVAPATDTGRESSGGSRGDGSGVPRSRAPDPGEFRFGSERWNKKKKKKKEKKRYTCMGSRCRALGA